jgi:Leucine-rich repeat (LRR) protein
MSTGCSRLEELLKIEPVIDGPVAITNYSYMRKLGKTELVWDNPADTSVATLTVNRSLSEMTYSNEMFFSDSEIKRVTTLTELIPSSTIRVMDENTADDKGYFYTVSSLDVNNNLLAYVDFKTSIDISAPSVITNLSSRRNNDENVVLNWENPKNIDFDYVVIRRSSIGNSVEGSEVYATTNAEQFVDLVSPDTRTYFYGVQSVDYSGNLSEIVFNTEDLDIVPPGDMTEFAFSLSNKGVSFSWENPIDPDFDHIIIRKIESTNGENLIDTAEIYATTNLELFIDTSIDHTKNYFYGFQTIDRIGNKSELLVVEIKSDIEPPDNISNLLYDVEKGMVTFTWENSEVYDFDHVIVKKMNSINSESLLETTEVYATTNLELFIDTTIDHTKSYFYGFQTIDRNGNKSELLVVEIKPDTDPPDNISNLLYDVEKGVVTFTWENSEVSDFDHVMVKKMNSINSESLLEMTEVYATTNLELFLDIDIDNSAGYFYGFQSVDIFGNASDLVIVEILANMYPPDKVSELNMERWYKQNSFTWKNPVDLDFSHVLIKKSLTKENLEDSPILLTTTESSFIDEVADNDTSYHYGFYSVDEIGNSSKFAYIFVDADGEITLPDTVFFGIVKDFIDKSDVPIFKTDLYGIEVISGGSKAITDISGIEWVKNLNELYLYHNQISDISSVASLTSLESLSLGDNQISDVSLLASLSNLNYLTLNDNQISDVSSLASLTSLEDLFLYRNQISDVSLLASLSNLNYLNLNENQISDVSSLASLTSLEILSLDYNQISDVSSLASLTNLKSLNLYYNQISDVSSLASLTSLERLSLGDNQISDVSSLASLTNLKSLNLYDNQISDVSSLASLTSLESLRLGANQISDVGSLSSLTSLKSLNLQSNQISDVSSLAFLTNLKSLLLYFNPISSEDIAWLKQLLPNTVIHF